MLHIINSGPLGQSHKSVWSWGSGVGRGVWVLWDLGGGLEHSVIQHAIVAPLDLNTHNIIQTYFNNLHNRATAAAFVI